MRYVDGGISHNLPVEPFLAIRDQVIAVHENSLPKYVPGKQGMFRAMDRFRHLVFREMVMRSAKGCHLFIEPSALSRFNMFELAKMEEVEEIGHTYAREILQGRGVRP